MRNSSSVLHSDLIIDRPIPESQEKAVRPEVSTIDAFQPYDIKDINSGQAAFEAYSRALRNPIVKNAMDTTISAVFWTEGRIVTNNKGSDNLLFAVRDEQIIPFLQDQLDTLSFDKFDSVLKSSLWSGQGYGYVVNEINWKRKNNFIIVDNIKPKPAWNFDLETDEFDNLLGVRWQETGEVFRADKFMFKAWPYLRESNHYGVSELNSILHDIEILEHLQGARDKASISLLIKPLVHYYKSVGRNPIDTINIKDAVVKYYNSDNPSVIQVGIGQDAEGKNQMDDVFQVLPDRASADALKHTAETIKEKKITIMRNFGINDELGFSDVSGGSLAKASVQFDMFQAKVEMGQRWVEDLVNHTLIPQMIKFNFRALPDGYKPPVWKFDMIEEDKFQANVVAFKELIEVGVINSSEPWIRERLEVPEKPMEMMNENIKND